VGRHRRWLGLLAALAGCAGAGGPPPETPASAAPAGSPLEAQIRSGRGSLLAGVSAPAEKKAIMRQVSRELGVECDHCHDVADFRAPTPNKTVAAYMFSHYASGLEPKQGGAVSCGTCHAGQARYLGDRADRERVKGIMKSQLVDGLRIRGGQPLACETCHGVKKDAPFLPRGASGACRDVHRDTQQEP
jgi:hypothetical protein